MTNETILLGEFAHESNTFAEATTDRGHFQERREYFGEEIPAKLTGTNTQVGGVIDVAEEKEVDLVHTVAASATPGGRVTADTYDFYCTQILEAVEEHAGEIDGVMLCLHGAMVPEGKDDGEGPLISNVRNLVGEGVPIAVTLDLHGNISEEMTTHADIPIGFESYPHVDMGDTGRNGMRALVKTIRNEIGPVISSEHPPVLAMGPKQNTRTGPMADVMAKAREYETRDVVEKVNVFPGFHQADIPAMGWSVSVITDGDQASGEEIARKLAKYIWNRREDFISDYPEPPEAIAEAKRLASEVNADDGFVLLADVGDNPGGGGAADGTTVLREMIDQDLTNAGFAIIRDPETVAQCINAGVGSSLTVDLGGKTDDLHGEPISNLDVYVKTITNGEFLNTGPMGTGSENHLGRAVLIECGADRGVSVIVTENRMQPLDAEIWRHMGIQPQSLDVLAVKSTNHYRADYEPMCSENIPINSIGLVAMDPRKFEFTNISHPQFPMDEMAAADYPDW